MPPARSLADTLVLPAGPGPGGGRRRARSAVRRVMVTPTFAAGLGVVIAAALAAPAATDLHYNAIPDRGRPCPAAGCQGVNGGDRNGLATAAPGVKLPTPAPQHLDGRRSGPAAGGGPPPGMDVRFETVRGEASGQWVGEIDVTTSSAHPLPAWSLTISYRSDQILRVWRDGWLPHGPHSATITAERAGAQPEGRPPGTPDSAIMIVASGPPGPPDTCTINGQPCRLG